MKLLLEKIPSRFIALSDRYLCAAVRSNNPQDKEIINCLLDHGAVGIDDAAWSCILIENYRKLKILLGRGANLPRRRSWYTMVGKLENRDLTNFLESWLYFNCGGEATGYPGQTHDIVGGGVDLFFVLSMKKKMDREKIISIYVSDIDLSYQDRFVEYGHRDWLENYVATISTRLGSFITVKELSKFIISFL